MVLSLIFNLIIGCLMIFSTISAIVGFDFMKTGWESNPPNWWIFKFFTVLSNIWAGLCALVMAGAEICMLAAGTAASNAAASFPTWAWALKLSGASAVMLTFVVTVCYLAPQEPKGYFALFTNWDLFYHAVIPLLCIISFMFIDKPAALGMYVAASSDGAALAGTASAAVSAASSGSAAAVSAAAASALAGGEVFNPGFVYTLAGVVPTALYAVFYTINVVKHLGPNKEVDRKYDWYNFLMGNYRLIPVVVPLICGVSYGFSCLLWAVNRI
ncbi:MAG: hypothetical protein HUJ69_06890 [Lachnospiraceae bacterium]|nr:hypothetical protein [Lachnospiraceae bacterium]